MLPPYSVGALTAFCRRGRRWHKRGFEIEAQTQQHNLLADERLPPRTRFTGAEEEPATPVAFKISRFRWYSR